MSNNWEFRCCRYYVQDIRDKSTQVFEKGELEVWSGYQIHTLRSGYINRGKRLHMVYLIQTNPFFKPSVNGNLPDSQ